MALGYGSLINKHSFELFKVTSLKSRAGVVKHLYELF
jgi:hypothetical protein